MKKENALKFTLTIAASVLLAACGSSGGSSAPAKQPLSAEEQAALKAKEAKAKDEKAKADEAKALKAEANERVVLGNKINNKTDSDVTVYKRAGRDVASVPTDAVVGDLDRSFDTLVVGSKNFAKSSEVLYLEDFRTKLSHKGKNENDVENDASNGVSYFENVYVTDKKKDAKSLTVKLKNIEKDGKVVQEYDGIAGATRDKTTTTVEKQKEDGKFERSNKGYLNEYGEWTKTDHQGDVLQAEVLVYRTNLDPVYFTQTGKSAGRLQSNLKAEEATKNKNKEYDSVAEIYGRTTTSRDSAEYKNGVLVVEDGNNNLPLYGDTVGEKKGTKVKGDRVQYVQYGRVTTALDSKRLRGTELKDSFKSGVDLGKGLSTYVAPYARFNTEGSKEDHYFFRGIDAVTPAKLVEYGFNKKDGKKVTYQGHAVTYGLDNTYHRPASLEAPSALHGIVKEKAVSGTHVTAVVDLAKREVNDGKLYNVFEVDGKNVADVLVTFDGKLKANGNVVGTSELSYNDTVKDDAPNKTGMFAGTLFGNQGLGNTELGGVVASHNGEKGYKWGAVFAAKANLPEDKKDEKHLSISDNINSDKTDLSNAGNVGVKAPAVEQPKQP